MTCDHAVNKMIKLTERAAEKVKENLSKRGKGMGIRIGVKTTGCSGLSYVLEYADTVCAEDQVFESNGVRMCVSHKHMTFLHGLEMDWIKQGLNEGFDFKNPNEKSTCGCGQSFTV